MVFTWSGRSKPYLKVNFKSIETKTYRWQLIIVFGSRFRLRITQRKHPQHATLRHVGFSTERLV